MNDRNLTSNPMFLIDIKRVSFNLYTWHLGRNTQGNQSEVFGSGTRRQARQAAYKFLHPNETPKKVIK